MLQYASYAYDEKLQSMSVSAAVCLSSDGCTAVSVSLVITVMYVDGLCVY